jgi:predicted metal-dependent peptidase
VNRREIEEKLTRARIRLLLSQPFFGSLCLRLKFLPQQLPTMATDGQRILYNPAFVETLRPEELEAVLAHEVLHCALGHHCRRGKRDPERWNRAADLAINPLLVANRFTLPAGALLDPAFAALSAEEIYARLPQRENAPSSQADSGQHQDPANSCQPGAQRDPSSPGAEGEGKNPQPQALPTGKGESTMPRPGGFGEVLDAGEADGSPASEAEKSRQAQEWNIAAEQAMRSSAGQGRHPAGLERWLRESRRSKRDWRALLRDFIAARSPSDYRWSPPNRRYVAAGLYLPSVERRGTGIIVVAIDTSGSIGSAELEQFAGELSAISEETQPETVHVVYCDSAVQSVQQFAAGESVRLAPKGGGGTDFRPVFTWVADHGVQPACLIYLTDLCCSKYPDIPGYPVLWVTASRRTAPFGETVRIEMETE